MIVCCDCEGTGVLFDFSADPVCFVRCPCCEGAGLVGRVMGADADDAEGDE